MSKATKGKGNVNGEALKVILERLMRQALGDGFNFIDFDGEVADRFELLGKESRSDESKYDANNIEAARIISTIDEMARECDRLMPKHGDGVAYRKQSQILTIMWSMLKGAGNAGGSKGRGDDAVRCANGCGKPGTKRCNGCKAVSYCSVECQRIDWKQNGHKVECKKTQARGGKK
eukprot:m.27967 g.27967  ORF g.27967 m.27967 type:complete len:176 (+) comp11973_c0_seq1:147-674(+)